MALTRSVLVAVAAFFVASSAAPANLVDVTLVERQAACPANFLNVVFNSPADGEPNWPGRYSSVIKSHGISNWIGFTSGAASGADATTAADQIRLATHVEDIATIMSAMNGQSGPVPGIVGTFNEPDGGWFGLPKISEQDALTAMQSMLDMQTSVQILSPAAAYPGEHNWLQNFMDLCGQKCLDKFTAMSIHVYNPDPQAAIGIIDGYAAQYPTKDIWITELAPATATGGSVGEGCTLDDAGVQNWMTTVLQHCVSSGRVKRVFWNNGEYESVPTCNPSLTNQDSSATALLQAYGAFCGSGGAAAAAPAAPAAAAPAPAPVTGLNGTATSRRRRSEVIIA